MYSKSPWILLGFLTLYPLIDSYFFDTQSYAAPKSVPVNPTTLQVRAKGRGDRLSKVEVKVGGKKLLTDSQGEVQIILPLEGNIEFYRRGYDPLIMTVKDLDALEIKEIFLFPATPSSDEIMITGVRRPEVSRKKIAVEEAVKVAPGGDPAQVPKLLPGVQSNNFSPEVVVRGSGPQESRYKVDDWAVPYIFHSIGNISIIPDQLLGDVEFSSGGFGPQDGNATGGVISLKTKNGVPERDQTEFRINVPIYSSIYHERSISEGKGKLALSARRSYIEKILPTILKKANEESGMNLTVVPYFGDAHIYYEKPRDDGTFKILGLYSYDGLQLAFPTAAAENEEGQGKFNIRDTVYLLGFQYTKNLGDNWSISTSPYISDVDRKLDILSNRIYVGATSLALQAEATKRFTGKKKLYIGSEIIHYWGRADVFVPRPDFNDPFFDFEEAPKVKSKVTQSIDELAAWTALDYDVGQWFFSPGFRLNHSTRIDKSGIDPRLNARYQLNEDNQLKMAVGQYSNVPEFAEVSKDFGNENLDFIKSYHYILGVETQWRPSWVTDFQGFYKETKGLVRSDPITNYGNKGQRINFGGEAFVRRNLTARLFGWLSYTYSQNRERDNDQETYRNSQYDQTHILNIVGNYKLNSVWDAGGRLAYHTGDTYTPVDGAVYNANLDKYQQRNNPDTRLFSKRLPNYHQMSIYSSRDILYDTWKLGLRFGVEFLALSPQATNVQYNYDYSKEQYNTNIPPIPFIELRGVL